MTKKIFIIPVLLFVLHFSGLAQQLSDPYITSPEIGSTVKLPISFAGTFKRVVAAVWYPGAKLVAAAAISYDMNGKKDYFLSTKYYTAIVDTSGAFLIPAINSDQLPPSAATNIRLSISVHQEYNGRKSNGVLFIYPVSYNIERYKTPEKKILIKKDFKTKTPKEDINKPIQKKVIKTQVTVRQQTGGQ